MNDKATAHGLQENKIFALLSYLSVLCIIPLLFCKDNAFVMDHGKHGLVLFLGETTVFVMHIILGSWFLKIGIFLFGALSIMGMIMSLKGEKMDIPFITAIARNIIL
jgi:uncharacterized membrane protein